MSASRRSRVSPTKGHPVEQASFFNKVLVLWLFPLLRLGSRRPLEKSDVWDLPRSYLPAVLLERFDVAWSSGSPVPVLWRALFRAFWYDVPGLVFFDHLCFVVMFIIPLLVSRVVRIVEEDNTKPVDALFALVIWAVVPMQGASVSASYLLSTRTGICVRTLLINVVFRKALSISAEARSRGLAPTSQILTLLSVDAERVYHALHMGHWVVGQLLVAHAVILLMLFKVGMPFIGGMLAMPLLMVMQATLARRLGSHRREMQHRGEARVQLLEQVVEGIRVVKFYHLEEPLRRRLEHLRGKEGQELRMVLYLRAVNSATAYLTPGLASCMVFVAFVLLGRKLTADEAFSTMASLLILRGPLGAVPICITLMTECFVSLGRMQRFLDLDGSRLSLSAPMPRSETAKALGSPPPVAPPPSIAVSPAGSIEASGARFSWPSTAGASLGEAPAARSNASAAMFGDLTIDSLHIRPGSLVCVVGPVGAGKTSFCLALLGQMPHVGGSLAVSGHVAYAPQEPWIVSGQVLENVLMKDSAEVGDEDRRRFDTAVKAAQLQPDLEQLPAGEHSEIGKNGVNLSGGQCARVGLARSLARFPTGNIIVLDDVLAAVDKGVARRLVEGVICGHGCEGKTRIVTLSSYGGLGLIEQADVVVELNAGVARQYNSYAEFQAASGYHAQLPASVEDKESGSPQWILDGLPLEYMGPSRRNLLGCGPSVRSLEEAVDGQLYLPEERHTGLLRLSTHRLYFGHAWRGRGLLVLFFIIIAIISAEAARLATDISLSLWVSRSDEEEEDLGASRAALYFGLTVLTVVLSIARAMLFMILARRASADVHARMLDSLLQASVPDFFDVVPSGRVLSRFGKDLDTVDTLLPHYLLETLQDLMLLLGTCGFIAFAAPVAFAVIVPGALLLIRARVFYTRSTRELQRLEGISRPPLLSLCTEAMQGIATIRTHDLEASFCERFAQLSTDNAKLFFHLQSCMPWIVVLGEIVAGSVMAGTAAGAVLFAGSYIEPAVAALAVTLSVQLVGKLQWTVRQSCEAEHHLTAVERLGHFESIPLEQYGGSAASGVNGSGAHGAQYDEESQRASLTSWPPHGAIEFREVTVRYRSHLPDVLGRVSFKVRPGERVGLVGRTGAGKSTVSLVLFRLLLPRSGAVLVDDTDLATLPLSVVRRGLAIIPQEPLTWAGTVRANLDPRGEMPEAASLWSALELVGLAPVVREWPEGLETFISGGGDSLSVGQRQLLAVARVLLRPRVKVLVLDEATASVDAAADALLQHALATAPVVQQATVLAIAHRLGTLANYDRVLALQPIQDGATTIVEIPNPGKAAVAGPLAAEATRAEPPLGHGTHTSI